MNLIHRDYYLKTMLFLNPHKIPFIPGWPRESTIKRWQTEGLPKDVDWEAYVYDKIGINMPSPKPIPKFSVDFKMIPWFEEKIIEHSNGQYTIQDWMGAIVQISDEYDYTYIRLAKDFVTRRWIKSPVECREDWQEMKKRYDADDPKRITELTAEDIIKLNERDSFLQLSVNGPFWQLREWMGFENLCIAMIEEPDFIEEMIEFWQEFVLRMFKRIFEEKKIAYDSVLVHEDMAYKAHSMISPQMTRHFLLPVYKKWIGFLRSQGVQLIAVDSDGYINDLIPIWIEAGFDGCEPVEVAAHNDIVLYREIYGNKMAYLGGVDKREIAAGGKRIEAELKRVSPLLETGGYIPSCDHAVPNDISLDNFLHYSKLLAKYTGWL